MKTGTKSQRTVSKSPLKYWFLLVKIEFAEPNSITAADFKSLVLQNMKTMYGEVGASTNICVRKFDEEKLEAILMVSYSHIVQLWTCLVTISDFCGKACTVPVLQTSQHLIAIGNASRQLIYST